MLRCLAGFLLGSAIGGLFGRLYERGYQAELLPSNQLLIRRKHLKIVIRNGLKMQATRFPR